MLAKTLAVLLLVGFCWCSKLRCSIDTQNNTLYYSYFLPKRYYTRYLMQTRKVSGSSENIELEDRWVSHQKCMVIESIRLHCNIGKFAQYDDHFDVRVLACQSDNTCVTLYIEKQKRQIVWNCYPDHEVKLLYVKMASASSLRMSWRVNSWDVNGIARLSISIMDQENVVREKTVKRDCVSECSQTFGNLKACQLYSVCIITKFAYLEGVKRQCKSVPTDCQPNSFKITDSMTVFFISFTGFILIVFALIFAGFIVKRCRSMKKMKEENIENELITMRVPSRQSEPKSDLRPPSLHSSQKRPFSQHSETHVESNYSGGTHTARGSNYSGSQQPPPRPGSRVSGSDQPPASSRHSEKPRRNSGSDKRPPSRHSSSQNRPASRFSGSEHRPPSYSEYAHQYDVVKTL